MKTPLKYVGSKAGLVSQIQSYVPDETTVIVEPFAGSGAFSFASGLPFYLMDSQPELINFYQVLISELPRLLRKLRKLAVWHNKQYPDNSETNYMFIRGQDRSPLEFARMDPVDRAARYYYIVYSGFNGLYRVNGQNACNTPYGKREFNPNIEALKSASKHLYTHCRGVSHQQFDDLSVLMSLIDSDEVPFVLIDPPYADGDDGKVVYRGYTPDKIDDQFYQRLVEYMNDLTQDGIPFLMTNTYCKLIRNKFSKWKIDKVPVKYKVSANGDRPTKFEAFISNNV